MEPTPPPSDQTQFEAHAVYHLDRASVMVRSVGGVPEEVLEIAYLAHAAGDHLFAVAAGYDLAQAYVGEHYDQRKPIPDEIRAALRAQHEAQKREMESDRGGA